MLVHGNKDFLADVVYIILELVIAVLAILGNVLVCWAVYLNSNLQNVTNYFVVSLAAADIAVGVLAIPFAITISTGFCAFFYGCLFIACFVLVLTQSSIFSLLAIAIDRIIAIRIPLRYNGLVTGSRAKGIIAICWVLSFIIGLTPMLGWNKCSQSEGQDTNNSSPNNCSNRMVACLFETVVTMEYMVYYNFFACVLLPLLIMFGIYLKIFMAARRQLKQMENKMVHGERSRSTLQKEVHAAKSLAIIVGLFAICWLPLHIINCFTLFCPGCTRAPLWLMYLAIILSHANSVVNPLIYAYRIREFRHTFRKIISQHILGRKEQFKTGTASSRTSTHGGDGENTSIRISEYALNVYTNGEIHRDPEKQDLSKCKAGLEWHQNGSALDMETNGHIPHSCKNGDLSEACKNMELLSEELIETSVSYSDLESSTFAAADVS
ncbi:adenosine receptor A2a [Alligator mississippiensis]|uniref:Adenosine receptor A2 n=1 Tax=Alligator mississippiensis TaxID=8496 RepID=A0A151N4M6_ALLMI|nr:adenosine receptor A2a [Alligator mississippiensis]XP_059569502.1 adenosine receptor A2a [Alligator mississippiensis]KYO31647.1 adenosine receptor A2a [Alligator mississippiensis]